MGIAGLLLTLAIARLVFGWQVALMAALIQGLFAKYIIEARLARVDIYLTFWVSVSLLILAIIFFGRRRRDWLWLLLGVSMGVAVLAKWVNVFMFVLPALLYGLAAFRSRRPRWIWLLAGFGALCLVSGSWLALLARELGTDTVLAAWNQEVSDNVASATNRAGHGVLYYIPQLFLITFPFSALTPIMFIIPFMPQLKAERSKLIWDLARGCLARHHSVPCEQEEDRLPAAGRTGHGDPRGQRLARHHQRDISPSS